MLQGGVAVTLLTVKFWNSNVEEAEEANVCRREAAVQGFKHSPILPLVIWEKAQRIAGDKWDESTAASVIEDTSVKNTKHSRSGVACEIRLLQKKVNTDEDRDVVAVQYKGISGFTLSNSTEQSDKGQWRVALSKADRLIQKSLKKLEGFF